ncbi:hypothetical protein L798_05184 [Zootermopsis nevadensis]|uniref:Uncharacterized protein n=1 Tax=Zootermopsis nevadensis TaxID=136037 RepID=A0A067RIL8_ZOONE|nr:hypothetical protein L798_05184 [Zootermopsis nevadensis]
MTHHSPIRTPSTEWNVSLEIMDCQIDFDETYVDTKPSEMINSKSAITGLCPHRTVVSWRVQFFRCNLNL